MSKDTLLYSVTYFVVDVLCSIRSDTQQSTDCTLNLAFTAARRQQTDQRRQHFTPRSSVHARTVHQHFSSHLSLIMRLTASWTRTTDRPTTTIHNYYLYSPNWHHRHCIHVQLSKCDRFPELWVPVTSRYDTITQEAQNWCVGSSWRKQKKTNKTENGISTRYPGKVTSLTCHRSLWKQCSWHRAAVNGAWKDRQSHFNSIVTEWWIVKLQQSSLAGEIA